MNLRLSVGVQCPAGRDVLAALGGLPLLLGALWASGRLARRADAAAADANSVLTERIIEFARTQQALRAARRVEPARNSGPTTTAISCSTSSPSGEWGAATTHAVSASAARAASSAPST